MSRQTNVQIMDSVTDASNVKRIANNTVRYTRPNGDTVYRLHNTDIVVKHGDGTFTLNSGGWKTPTTKERLNTYAPVRVFSHKGMWQIGTVPFYDGMKVDAHGLPLNSPDATNLVDDNAKLKKAITKFVRTIDDCEALPTPNNGDCWACLMFNAEKANDPKAKPDYRTTPGQTGPATDTGHLLSHIEEGYLHGSLLVNAMRWKGYSDQGIGLYYGMAERGDRATFKRALRDYLKRKFGLV